MQRPLPAALWSMALLIALFQVSAWSQQPEKKPAPKETIEGYWTPIYSEFQAKFSSIEDQKYAFSGFARAWPYFPPLYKISKDKMETGVDRPQAGPAYHETYLMVLHPDGK